MVRTRRDSFRGRIWKIPEPHDLEPIPGTPYPDFVTKLLRQRGVKDQHDAAVFLFDEPIPEPDPTLLGGFTAALDRIEAAIRRGETMAVYGDFDVDGVTATVILTEVIRDLGGRVIPYIPDRFQEGYGVHDAALDQLDRDGVSLVITADCGLSSREEVAAAGARGQEVVIFDHHAIPTALPAAAAIVHPEHDNAGYPNTALSTGGLAYRFAPALMERCGRSPEPTRWLDLATLSTIADVMPLTGENRGIVREGLRAIARSSRPGLRALREVAGYAGKEIDVEAVSFGLAPRINAAGRLTHAMRAFDLLIETDNERARVLAKELDDRNQERQRLTAEALARARAHLADDAPAAPITIIGDPEIPQGIVGLVAGRLADEYYRPAVVYEEKPDACRGSCRSIPEFNITEALKNCGELFERYGGHRAAAGFTARPEAMPQIRERLTAEAAKKLQGVRLEPRIEVDGQVPLSALRGSQVAWLSRLGPFGANNPAPAFVSNNVLIANARRIGNGDEHLRLTLRDGPTSWAAIGFRLGACPVQAGDRVDLVWSLRSANGAGERRVELEVQDLAPASA